MSLELLVIEDEDDIRECIIDIIGPFFDKVCEAKNGFEALDVLNTSKPNLIVCDFNMPKLNGVEFIKLIKSKHNKIPIIVLTGRGSQEVRRMVWAYGIWEYFEKPFDPKAFKDCVKNVISMTKNELENYNKPIKLLNFEEVNILLEKRVYTPFVNHCLSKGLSPSTVIEQLVSDFIAKEIDESEPKRKAD